MARHDISLMLAALLVGFAAVFCHARDERSNLDEGATDAAEASEQGPFLLRYRFTAGETLRWKVTHMATTETRIKGNTQSSTSHSVSTKRWHVDSVDDGGNITLTHVVENVDMWQKLSDRPEVRYNSDKDEVAPREYRSVAETIGVPLTTVTINAEGGLIERKSGSGQPSFGLGDMVMMLPPKPAKVGSDWYEPSEVPIRQPDDTIKRIKVRKLYTLKSVRTGVATIEVRTEILTPISEASIKAQLIQRLTNGVIKFDIDAGRILSRQIDWDETVVGFSGNESMMKYLARFTEELVPAVKTAARDKPQS
jgi:hypothetical protein